MFRITCIHHDGSNSEHQGDSLWLLLKVAKANPECRWVVIEVREAGQWRTAQETDLNKAMRGVA